MPFDQNRKPALPRGVFLENLYTRHHRGAVVRSISAASLWFSALMSYLAGVITTIEFSGISISLGFLILMNPPTLWILKKIYSLRVYELFSLFINELEIICYTGIIYYSGGIEAAYLTLIYCVLVAYTGMIAPRRTPFIVAGFCAATFLTMVVLEYAGFLIRYPLIDSWGEYPQYPLTDQLATTGIVIALLFVMAFISAYTSKILRSRTARLATANKKLLQQIEERKKTEVALRESEEKLARLKKMESIGVMAGGIAHDLNNILSGIVSIPDLILMDMAKTDPLRKKIEIIKESGLRAADVVSELLTLAKGVATGKDVFNLNTIIEESLHSAEVINLKNMRPMIDFKKELDPDLLNIKCSSLHIKKCLMNLMTNAVDAMGDTGVVIISARNRYMDETYKGYEDVPTGEYVLLAVSDTGTGISAKDLERIFELFYTKKTMGRRGTGLGLSVVWNTVKAHDGYINVKSSQDGTVVELYFPATRASVTGLKEDVSFDDCLGNNERILVVDDEIHQREIACSLLNKLNYISEAVSSGEDAIEYLKKHTADLIILDMIMPAGINGRQTYEEIIKIRPGQKAIIASGYSETDEVKKAQQLGAGPYIKKPYTIEKICLAIKEELKRVSN